MTYFPVTSLIQTTCDVNANSTDSVTESLATADAKYLGLFVTGETGSHNNHVVTIQISPDGESWSDNACIVTGAGAVDDALIIAPYVRAKVKTAEGETSTVSITINIK